MRFSIKALSVVTLLFITSSESSLFRRETQDKDVLGNVKHLIASSNMGTGGDPTNNKMTEVCENFEKSYFDEFSEKFATQCTCSESATGGYTVGCKDMCENCLEGVCNVFYEFNQFASLEGEFDSKMSTKCVDFSNHSDGATMCLSEDSIMRWFTVDGEECNSVRSIDCMSEGDYVIDCSNLGYGNEMNFCDGTNLMGPFSYWFKVRYSSEIDDLKVGTCSNVTVTPRKGGRGGGTGGSGGGDMVVEDDILSCCDVDDDGMSSMMRTNTTKSGARGLRENSFVSIVLLLTVGLISFLYD